jgi:hypothetical protein
MGRSTRLRRGPIYPRGLLGPDGAKSVQPIAAWLGLHGPFHRKVTLVVPHQQKWEKLTRGAAIERGVGCFAEAWCSEEPGDRMRRSCFERIPARWLTHWPSRRRVNGVEHLQ